MKNSLREGSECLRCGHKFREDEDWAAAEDISGSAICMLCFRYKPTKIKQENKNMKKDRELSFTLQGLPIDDFAPLAPKAIFMSVDHCYAISVDGIKKTFKSLNHLRNYYYQTILKIDET